MNTENLEIPQADIRKLLSAASPDAALLYLYLKSGNAPENAETAIQLSPSRLSCAGATLRQLGLWEENARSGIIAGERPNYSEEDVMEAMDSDHSFRSLYGEVQRVLGRNLNTEELKILLSFIRYLGMPEEVISVLVCYCKERARQRGSLRNPSLRSIEKEAYAWAERGIDTLEEAAAYIQTQNVRNSQMGRLKEILQIRGRNLTPAENKYATRWLELGFDEGAISVAYERTCLNTGGLKWNYMDKILMRWHEAGLHTGEQVARGDRKPDVRSGERQLDAEEQAAIARMMREG